MKMHQERLDGAAALGRHCPDVLRRATRLRHKQSLPVNDQLVHPIIRSSSTGMRLVRVGAGLSRWGRRLVSLSERTLMKPTRLTFTKPFYLGVYEVTQGELTHVMGFNPSTVRGSDRLPVQTSHGRCSLLLQPPEQA